MNKHDSDISLLGMKRKKVICFDLLSLYKRKVDFLLTHFGWLPVVKERKENDEKISALENFYANMFWTSESFHYSVIIPKLSYHSPHEGFHTESDGWKSKQTSRKSINESVMNK